MRDPIDNIKTVTGFGNTYIYRDNATQPTSNGEVDLIEEHKLTDLESGETAPQAYYLKATLDLLLLGSEPPTMVLARHADRLCQERHPGSATQLSENYVPMIERGIQTPIFDGRGRIVGMTPPAYTETMKLDGIVVICKGGDPVEALRMVDPAPPASDSKPNAAKNNGPSRKHKKSN